MAEQTKITVASTVNAPVGAVWKAWNNPDDIVQWNTADPGWHTPASENDLSVNGKFKHRMEAKDGSFGFDFEGTYTKVELHKQIAYIMPDGRTVSTVFAEREGQTLIETIFDAETENDPELQQQGWQAILTNFAKYVEASNKINSDEKE